MLLAQAVQLRSQQPYLPCLPGLPSSLARCTSGRRSRKAVLCQSLSAQDRGYLTCPPLREIYARWQSQLLSPTRPSNSDRQVTLRPGGHSVDKPRISSVHRDWRFARSRRLPTLDRPDWRSLSPKDRGLFARAIAPPRAHIEPGPAAWND